MHHAYWSEQQLLMAELVFKQEMGILGLAFARGKARSEADGTRKNAA